MYWMIGLGILYVVATCGFVAIRMMLAQTSFLREKAALVAQQSEALAVQEAARQEEERKAKLQAVFDRWAEEDRQKEQELQDAYAALDRGLVSRHDIALIEKDEEKKKGIFGEKNHNLDRCWFIPNEPHSRFERVIRPAKPAYSLMEAMV